MTVSQIVTQLGLTSVGPLRDAEITGAIASDLISDILANGKPGQVWLTIQTHRNVAAVASAQGLAAVVLTGGREAGEDLLALAEAEEVNLLLAPEETFCTAGRLYALGIR